MNLITRYVGIADRSSLTWFPYRDKSYCQDLPPNPRQSYRSLRIGYHQTNTFQGWLAKGAIQKVKR